MQFYDVEICRVMIISFGTLYTKHDDGKNWRPNQRKIARIINRKCLKSEKQ